MYGHIKTTEQWTITQQYGDCTLAVDGLAATFGTTRLWPPIPLLAVPNVTAHPLTDSVPTSHYSMWYYNCLYTLKSVKHVQLIVRVISKNDSSLRFNNY